MRMTVRLKDIDDLSAEMGWKGGPRQVESYIIKDNEQLLGEISQWLMERGLVLGKLSPELIWNRDVYRFETRTAIRFDLPDDIAALFTLKFG